MVKGGSLMKSVKWIIGVVISISIFLVMLITAVDWTVCHNEAYFQTEFEKYNVEENTKADMTSLMYVADEMMKYLLGERDDLILPVTIRGEVTEFFSEQAKEHMVDVRNLFLMAITIRRVCLIMILVGLLFLILTKQQFGKIVSKCFNLTSAVVAGIGIVLSVLVSLNFTHAFTIFHQIFFRNDLWLLDSEDTLVNLVPEGFFIDTVIRIGLIFIGMFVACLSLSILYRVMFVAKKFEKKESDAETVITGYKTEKEEFLMTLEEGSMNWENFRKEEAIREKAYKRLRRGAKYDELYDKEEGLDNSEEEPNMKKEEPQEKDSSADSEEGTELEKLTTNFEEIQEIEERGENEGIERTEVIEETGETEGIERTEVIEETGETEGIERTEVIEETGETEDIERTEAIEETQEIEEIQEQWEPQKESNEVAQLQEEMQESEQQLTEPAEELAEEQESTEPTEEIAEEQEVIEPTEEIAEEPEPIEPTEEIVEEQEYRAENSLEEEKIAKEEQEENNITENRVEQDLADEPEIINLDEPELEIIHVDDMEVVEDSRLAIKGIELEKARLESERLHRQYGIPYEELSQEEEKSLQERMQQLMDEYNVIQP